MAQDLSFGIASLRDAFSSLPFGKTAPDMEKMLMMMPHLQASMLKAAVDRQRELIDFVGRRCDEDMKFAEKLGSAASVSDIYSAFSAFCKDATSQYAAEFGKAAEANSKETMKVVENLKAQQAEMMATVTDIKATTAKAA